VCELFDWRKPNGSVKEMSARVALPRMHREGLIELPAPRHKVSPCRSFTRRTAQAEAGELLQVPVKALEDLHLELVERRTSALWNASIERCHSLDYKPLPGAQLRYFAMSGERGLGLLGFGVAAWKSAPRDEWIGWSRAQRHLSGVVNKCRYLRLPWVCVEHLASPLLAMAARALPAHWEGRYGDRPVLLETFVEVERFAGTCYRAASWTCLGHTQGRGKLGDHRLGQVPVKTVWAHPLAKNVRAQRCR
jgi:hypothetical protein